MISLLLSLYSLVTYHFLDRKQMRNRTLTSFCQFYKKTIKNTCRNKKSLHQDMVCFFKYIWIFEKYWNILITKRSSIIFPSDFLATIILNTFKILLLRDKTKLNFSDQCQSKFLLPKSQNEFYELILRIFLPFPRALRRRKLKWRI
jgi:hypothetical protein